MHTLRFDSHEVQKHENWSSINGSKSRGKRINAYKATSESWPYAGCFLCNTVFITTIQCASVAGYSFQRWHSSTCTHAYTCTHTYIHTSYIPHALNTIEGKLSSNKEMVSMLSNLASRQGLGISQTKNMAEVMLCDSAMEEYSFPFTVCPSLSFSLPPSFFLLPPSLFLSP